MGILQEFKEFALKGNVVDMAVGIVIGAAFSTIIRSLVDDIIMPPMGLLMRGVDFSNLFITLGSGTYDTLAQAKQAGAPTLNIGLFINNLISFLIVALVLFMVIKTIITMQKRFAGEPPAIPPKPTKSEIYLKEIRDALVKK